MLILESNVVELQVETNFGVSDPRSFYLSLLITTKVALETVSIDKRFIPRSSQLSHFALAQQCIVTTKLRPVRLSLITKTSLIHTKPSKPHEGDLLPDVCKITTVAMINI